MASPDLDSPSAALRAAIRELHDRIEATPLAAAMATARISREDYSRIVAQSLALHERLEPRLAACPSLSGVFHDGMRRVEALRRDVGVWGSARIDLSPVEALVAALDEAAAQHPATWLGVLYVLEGSRMGSRVLAPRLSEALGVPAQPGCGLDVHILGAEETPRRLAALKLALDERLASKEARAAACDGARQLMRGLTELYAASPVAERAA